MKPSICFRSEFVMAVADVVEHTDFFMPDSNLFPIHRYPLLKVVTPLKGGKPYDSPLFAYYHVKYQGTKLMLWLCE